MKEQYRFVRTNDPDIIKIRAVYDFKKIIFNSKQKLTHRQFRIRAKH